MSFTSRYEFEKMDYSTSDKSSIVSNDLEILDENIHTLIEGTAGATIDQYEACYFASDGKYKLAQANGSLGPCLGLCIDEDIISDDEIRIQRIGNITNTGWSWGTVGNPIYLSSATAGALTETPPSSNVQVVGFILSATSIYLNMSIEGMATTAHSSLGGLDYASANHTGFQPTGDYATDTELTNTSGTLQTNINAKPDNFLDLPDTIDTYVDGNYLRTTSSGITSISGIILTASDDSEWLLQVTTSGVLYTTSV